MSAVNGTNLELQFPVLAVCTSGRRDYFPGPETLATKGSLAQAVVLKNTFMGICPWIKNILPVAAGDTPLMSGGLKKGDLSTLRGALRVESSLRRLSKREEASTFYAKRSG